MNKIIAVLVFTQLSAQAAGLSAKEVMEKSEKARQIASLVAEAKITTTKNGKEPNAKEFHFWRKLGADQRGFSTLTRFLTPASIRDQAILFLEKSRDTNEILLYLPRFKNIRRVEGQSQSSSFMGSAFSYSDIASQHADEFSHQLLKLENCPGETVQCHVIESIPVSEYVADRTGYGKMVQWIHPAHFLPVKGEYYDKDKKTLKKKMESKKISSVSKDGKWFAHWIRFEEPAHGSASEIEFTEVKTDKELPASLFSQQNLTGSR